MPYGLMPVKAGGPVAISSGDALEFGDDVAWAEPIGGRAAAAATSAAAWARGCLGRSDRRRAHTQLSAAGGPAAAGRRFARPRWRSVRTAEGSHRRDATWAAGRRGGLAVPDHRVAGLAAPSNHGVLFGSLLGACRVVASARRAAGHGADFILPRSTTGQPLNNAYIAAALSKLLRCLEHDGTWVPRDDVPLILVGIGNGANVATAFALDYLADEAHDALRQALRCMMLCNPFAHTGHGLLRALRQLRRLHDGGDEVQVERVEHLAAMLFSDEYLARATRKGAMRTFYATRRVLQDPVVAAGTSRLLHGAANHEDLRANLLDLPAVPLLVVQSAKDALVLPAHSEPFAQAFEAVHRSGAGVTRTIEELVCAARGQLVAHFAYVGAGHELLQERARFVQDTLVRVIDAAANQERREVQLDLGAAWYEEQERKRLEAEREAHLAAEAERLAKIREAEEAEARKQRAFEATIQWSDEEEGSDDDESDGEAKADGGASTRKRRPTDEALEMWQMSDATRRLIKQWVSVDYLKSWRSGFACRRRAAAVGQAPRQLFRRRGRRGERRAPPAGETGGTRRRCGMPKPARHRHVPSARRRGGSRQRPRRRLRRPRA